jgi:hypothetical protein
MSAAPAYRRAPTPRGAQSVPVVAATGATVAFQSARVQLLLARIAAVSDVAPGAASGAATMTQLLRALDERRALLTELETVVAELSTVRGQLGGAHALTAGARALDLAVAPVEQAAQRALCLQAQLVAKMEAMRDELLWEVDRLGHSGAAAHRYLSESGALSAARDRAGRSDVPS